jgi:DNA-binding CsgD family transcriptional regulator
MLGYHQCVLRGRDEVVSMTDRWLAGLRGGEGGTLHLVGGPGVGKTTLLNSFAESASAQGFRVIRATGHPEESGITWAGLSQMLAPHLGVLTQLEQRPRSTLMRTMRLTDHGVVDQVAIGMALLYFLTFFDEPTLVVIDDLQWMDQATVSIVQFVSRRLQATGVGFLVAGHLNSNEVSGTRIAIEPMTLADLRAIARDRGAASAVADLLAEQALGLPLILDQAISQLDPDQLLGRTPLPELPLEIESGDTALNSRGAELPTPTRRLLAAGALAPHLSLSELSDQLRFRSALELLAPAVDGGLVEPHQERLIFRHPTLRAAAIRGLSLAERQEIHRVLAQHADVQHRGWHLAAAASTPDADAAAALDELAADATSRGAHFVALRALQTAMNISPVPQSERTLAAARAAVRARLPEVALTLSASCDSSPEREALTAEIAWVSGQVGPARDKWVEVVNTSTAPADLRHESRRRAAIAAFRMYDGPGVRALTAEHVAADPIIAITAAGAEVISGRTGAIDRLLAGAQALMSKPPDPSEITALAEVVSLALARGNRTAELGKLAEEINQLAAESAAQVVPALLIARAVHTSRADLLGGIALIRQALSLCEEWDLAEHRPFALAIAAICEASVDSEDAPQMIADIRSYGIPVAIAVADYAQALIHYGRSEYELALGLLSALHERHPHELSFGFLWHADLVDIALRVGDEKLAQRVAADLADWERSTESLWVKATISRAKGLLAVDRAEADQHFLSAAEVFETNGYMVTAGRTRLDWAERLRRDRQRSAARAQVQRAQSLLIAGGARRWVERCEREGEILGLSPSRTMNSALEVLSPREIQVARWLVAGLTFRQIGARLFLSPRTAESHGQAIYRKLGVRGRAELAEMARRDPALHEHPN